MSEISHVYILWQINNAGTNKGFRPLLHFTDEDINQVKLFQAFMMTFLVAKLVLDNMGALIL